MYPSAHLPPEEAQRGGARSFLENRREVRIQDLHAGDVFYEVSVETGRVARYEAISDAYLHKGSWWIQAVSGQIDDLPGPVGPSAHDTPVRYCR